MTVEVMPPEKPITVKIAHRLAGPRAQLTFSANDGEDLRIDMTLVMMRLDDAGRECVRELSERLNKEFGSEPKTALTDSEGVATLLKIVCDCISRDK
jgi:flagellar motor switch protein FliG